MMNVAVMGFGIIDSGVYEAPKASRQLITEKVGQEIAVKYILDLRDFPGAPVKDKIVHDFSRIVEGDDISIVAEIMGGSNPAYPLVRVRPEARKHAATSNKALVAAYGTELPTIARERQVDFISGANVGGGAPTIRPLYRCLTGGQILEITGISNGATNFILTKMGKKGTSFNDALKEAQDLDYAGWDPGADMGGRDTRGRITTLATMTTDREVNCEDIYTGGIMKITDTDFKYAGKMRANVRPFDSNRMDGDVVHAWMTPLVVGKNHPLYSVNDIYNGITVKGNMVGTTMLYGSGASKLSTTSAVVTDIMEAATHPGSNVSPRWSSERLNTAPVESPSHHYFVQVSGRYEVPKDMVANYLENIEVVTLEGLNEYAVVTDRMGEAKFRQAAKGLAADLNQSYQGVLWAIRARL